MNTEKEGEREKEGYRRDIFLKSRRKTRMAQCHWDQWIVLRRYINYNKEIMKDENWVKANGFGSLPWDYNDIGFNRMLTVDEC